MNTKCILCALLLIPMPSLSQQLFQDASGETKIFIGTDKFGWLFYNTSDKSATIGYNQLGLRSTGYDWQAQEADLIIGGDLKVATKDGLGNIFSKGAVNTGFTLSGNFGFFKDNFRKGNYLNVYIRPQISYKQYSNIDTISIDYTIHKIKKLEGSVLLNVNLQFNGVGLSMRNGVKTIDEKKKRYKFFSVQTGFKQINNNDDLDDGQIVTTRSILGAKTIETIETGKLGNYNKSNTIPINVDVAFTPRIFKTNYIGFNGYYRKNLLKSKNSYNVGIGTYLADPKKPSKISGGLGWQFNDVSNKLRKDTNVFGRSTVFFYVGYSIGPG